MDISNLLGKEYDDWKLDNNEQEIDDIYSVVYVFEGKDSSLDDFEKELEELMNKYDIKKV